MIRSWVSVVGALLAATFAGSLALSIEAVLFLAWNALAVGDISTFAASQALMSAATGVLFVAPIFLIGLLVVGVPVWLMISGTQVRSRVAAAFIGAVLAAAVAAIVLALLGGSPWRIPLLGGIALILPGAAAGWTLHRVAYGKAAKL